jgi:Asp-tRNA(Asn)/Glu-tRNA(Gln) amidotransferase A subunit family amidase
LRRNADMAIPGTISLQDLTTALQSGDLALLDYLDQLEAQFAAFESQVQAFVPEPLRFARLRKEAEQLLDLYARPVDRPALFGVAVGVKDIFHVDGFITRAGSRLDSDLIQGNESEAITKVKEAGALILGKTVTTEFAYFAPGSTRNPHDLEHTPGGSSSGSAASVAAGLCSLAFGTQTIGSINRPAAFCGVVGYKPSHDRISKKGVIPVSPAADHVGFFVPHAGDVQIVAPLLCREWQPATPDRSPVLGIPDGPYLKHASPEGLAHFKATCERLIEAGFSLKHAPIMPDFYLIYERHNIIVAAEAAQTHKDWYPNNSILYHPKTAELIERGQHIDEQTLQEARQGQAALREMLAGAMDEYGIDLWLSPSAVGPAPRGLESTGDPVMNLPWTHAGVPTITLPSGFSANDLPLGLQLAARWYRDEDLLAWAPGLEQALKT